MRYSISLLLVPLLLLGGCVTPEPNAADPVNTGNYLLNTFESRLDASIEKTVEAFDDTMKSMEFIRTDIDRKESEAVLTYRGAGDTGVEVKLKRFPDYLNVKIRYGIVGNEHQSRRIFSSVVDRL